MNEVANENWWDWKGVLFSMAWLTATFFLFFWMTGKAIMAGHL
jgi:hypothetical protein